MPGVWQDHSRQQNPRSPQLQHEKSSSQCGTTEHIRRSERHGRVGSRSRGVRGGTSAGLRARGSSGGIGGSSLGFARCRRDPGGVVAGREADGRVATVDIAVRGPVETGLGRCGSSV